MEDMEVQAIGNICFTETGVIIKVPVKDFLAIERAFGYVPTGPPGVPTLHKASTEDEPLNICLVAVLPEEG
jgi:hypothetical protein